MLPNVPAFPALDAIGAAVADVHPTIPLFALTLVLLVTSRLVRRRAPQEMVSRQIAEADTARQEVRR